MEYKKELEYERQIRSLQERVKGALLELKNSNQLKKINEE